MDVAIPVTLIVKAPNQQFEDQTIQCELTWNIKRLKGYLSEVYPCKPSFEEQKLIYSGQLLSDTVVLKDILRQYEGQDTHTVHLVYTPKNRNYYNYPMSSKKPEVKETKAASPAQPTSSSTSTPAANSGTSDGLRQRNVSSTPAPASNVQQPMNPQPFFGGIVPPQANFMPAMPGLAGMAGMPFMAMPPQQQAAGQQQFAAQDYTMAQQVAMQQQQVAMMQQMYLQYLNHYTNGGTGTQPNYQYMPFYQPTLPGSFPPNVSQSAHQYQNVPDQVPAPEPNMPAVQPQRPAPALDDENENRDWLEIFYTFSRLIVLLSLVYFYSSPIRCSIVIFVMILYYLYHNHQRTLRERQTQAAAEASQREAAQAAEAAEAAPTENNTEGTETTPETAPESTDEARENAPTVGSPSENSPESVGETVASPSASADQDDNNRLPTVTLLRTFVLSFFASLIPETPAV